MPRYAFVQRLLHWLIAIAVIATLGVGILLDSADYKGLVEAYGQPTMQTRRALLGAEPP